MKMHIPQFILSMLTISIAMPLPAQKSSLYKTVGTPSKMARFKQAVVNNPKKALFFGSLGALAISAWYYHRQKTQITPAQPAPVVKPVPNLIPGYNKVNQDLAVYWFDHGPFKGAPFWGERPSPHEAKQEAERMQQFHQNWEALYQSFKENSPELEILKSNSNYALQQALAIEEIKGDNDLWYKSNNEIRNKWLEIAKLLLKKASDKLLQDNGFTLLPK